MSKRGKTHGKSGFQKMSDAARAALDKNTKESMDTSTQGTLVTVPSTKASASTGGLPPVSKASSPSGKVTTGQTSYYTPTSHTEVWTAERKDMEEQKVYAGKASRAVEREYDLIIDLTARDAKPIIWGHNLNPALQKFVDRTQILYIDWPDYSTPPISAKGWAALAKAILEDADIKRVYIGCMGGVGRTGTALAILAHFMGILYDKEDPVEFVRRFYFDEAVETESQFTYIEKVTGRKIGPDQKPSRRYGGYSSYGSYGWKSDVYGAGGGSSVKSPADSKSPSTISTMGSGGKTYTYEPNAADGHIEMELDFKNEAIILYTNYDGSDIDVIEFDTDIDKTFRDTVKRANERRLLLYRAFEAELYVAEEIALNDNALVENPIEAFFANEGDEATLRQLAEDNSPDDPDEAEAAKPN